MANNRIWGDEYRTTTVCVDSFENGVFLGRLYNPYLDDGCSYESMVQFLTQMESVLEEMDFPKSFTAVRTFAQPPSVVSDSPGIEFRPGDAATFQVKILFRQNASWQGSVTWLEGKQEQSFRSVLELILLMNSALCEEKSA